MSGSSSPLPPVVVARVAMAVAVRPGLWGTAALTVARLAAPRWWRRWPPVPRPTGPYAAFRLHTALGSDPGARLSGEEVVAFLEWCRRMRSCQRVDRAAR